MLSIKISNECCGYWRHYWRTAEVKFSGTGETEARIIILSLLVVRRHRFCLWGLINIPRILTWNSIQLIFHFIQTSRAWSLFFLPCQQDHSAFFASTFEDLMQPGGSWHHYNSSNFRSTWDKSFCNTLTFTKSAPPLEYYFAPTYF